MCSAYSIGIPRVFPAFSTNPKPRSQSPSDKLSLDDDTFSDGGISVLVLDNYLEDDAEDDGDNDDDVEDDDDDVEVREPQPGSVEGPPYG